MQFSLLLLTSLVVINVSADLKDCVHRDFGNDGTVCVCNEQHCDNILPVKPVPSTHFVTYTSNKEGLRFSRTLGEFQKNPKTTSNVIIVDRNQKFQTINGWGGAFTDATGINALSLGENAKNFLIRSYFSEEGIEYSLCRVPIGGTDFSTHGYSYNDGDEDKELRNFKLAPEDYQYKLPLIKEAQNLTNNKLQFFASAWTAPKWMKTNNDYSGFGFLKEEMYQAWANYFIKFLDEYKKEGINFWGLTTGNEPSLGVLAVTKINSVGWFSSQMRKWIAENLGPTLRNSEHSSIKLMALDDQRFYLPWFVDELFENETTKNYVDGIAYHWYWNWIIPSSIISKTHDKYPSKFILSTEACKGDKPFEQRVVLGSWKRGEEYVNDIIENLQNWVTGWIDWNMALDVTGGPTYIGNSVDSPVIVNNTSKEFYKQPMFYGIGHFSKFIPSGSIRIETTSSNNKVKSVALQRPDNGTTIVILNKGNKAVPLIIRDNARGDINIEISAKSFTTVLYW